MYIFHPDTFQNKKQANFFEEWKHSWEKCPVITISALENNEEEGSPELAGPQSPSWLRDSSAEHQAYHSLSILTLTF